LKDVCGMEKGEAMFTMTPDQYNVTVLNRYAAAYAKKTTVAFLGGLALILLMSFLGACGQKALQPCVDAGVGDCGTLASSLTPTATTTVTQTPTVTPSLTPTITPTPLPQKGDTWTRPADQMVMVYVPRDSFMMGSSNGINVERPSHRVALDSFWMDKTELTNAMYALCVQAGKCSQPGNLSYYDNSADSEFPVVYVNWYQAKAYCEWVGARLPTEAEWEYAARGTDGRTYPWGNQAPDNTLANFNNNNKGPVDVDLYPKGVSPFGALNMAGNVWEWVSDWFDWYGWYDASSTIENPLGPATGIQKVVRGGSWRLKGYGLRTSYRGIQFTPTSFDVSIGFRCVRSR
jgi:formylglycine-generating enzyme required for sulfatase activity